MRRITGILGIIFLIFLVARPSFGAPILNTSIDTASPLLNVKAEGPVLPGTLAPTVLGEPGAITASPSPVALLERVPHNKKGYNIFDGRPRWLMATDDDGDDADDDDDDQENEGDKGGAKEKDEAAAEAAAAAKKKQHQRDVEELHKELERMKPGSSAWHSYWDKKIEERLKAGNVPLIGEQPVGIPWLAWRSYWTRQIDSALKKGSSVPTLPKGMREAYERDFWNAVEKDGISIVEKGSIGGSSEHIYNLAFGERNRFRALYWLYGKEVVDRFFDELWNRKDKYERALKFGDPFRGGKVTKWDARRISGYDPARDKPPSDDVKKKMKKLKEDFERKLKEFEDRVAKLKKAK